MADNIRNFNDYRKKSNLGKQETEEINIEIQDPLDFLSASEREEYYRTQHDAMDRERESIKEDSPEYYFDEEKPEAIKEESVTKEESELYSENKEISERNSEKRKPSQRHAERKDKRTEEAEHRRADSRKTKVERDEINDSGLEHRKGRHRVEDEEWFDEDEDKVGGIDPYLLVRIASALTGIVVLIFLALLFKVKIYDAHLKPDPDEITGTMETGLLDGYTYVSDTVTTTTDLNLRNTPSTSSDEFIVTQVPEGTVLERVAVSDDGNWAQVLYNDEVLYCAMKYLNVNE